MQPLRTFFKKASEVQGASLITELPLRGPYLFDSIGVYEYRTFGTSHFI